MECFVGIAGWVVTVLGIAARNGVMLVSHYRHLEEQEGEPFSREMIIRGAEERLVPILMTASATALALLPSGGNRQVVEVLCGPGRDCGRLTGKPEVGALWAPWIARIAPR